MTAPVTAEKPLRVRDTTRLGSMRREHGASKGLALEFEKELAAKFKIPVEGGAYRIVLVPPNATATQEQRMHLQWYATQEPQVCAVG